MNLYLSPPLENLSIVYANKMFNLFHLLKDVAFRACCHAGLADELAFYTATDFLSILIVEIPLCHCYWILVL